MYKRQNNWVVSGTRTKSGKPLLANDPHLGFTQPPRWYEMHLKGGRFNVSGLCLAGIPMPIIGQNENIAWGFTVNKPDLSDSYLLEVNPENENQYLLDGEWVDFKIETVRLPIKLFGPLKWTVKREAKYSVHGPVLEVADKSYALRFSGMSDIKQVNQWLSLIHI